MSDGSNPQEKEYIIGTKQEPYIDRKELEKLLLKVFKKNITVYVSIPHFLWPRKLVLVAHLIQIVAPQQRVQVYSLARGD
jgi:hypothetical protein